MERLIDFFRPRLMLCGVCGHQWFADLKYLERWSQAKETCEHCGTDCEHENGARPTVVPDDPVLADAEVPKLFWYHTSTHADWPSKTYEPTAGWTEQGRRRMERMASKASWEAKQRAKALHVGTYEAAIENMLRRMDDQGDRDSQFHLYRVHLRPDVDVRAGWLPDPGGLVGDVPLNEVCPPGIDVTRYLNRHEDEGGLSLALGRGAIESVQQIMIPLRATVDDPWVASAATGVLDAPREAQGPPTSRMELLGRSRPTPRITAARSALTEVSGRLPVNLRDQFERAAALSDSADPYEWAQKASGIVQLVLEPSGALSALDAQPRRTLS